MFVMIPADINARTLSVPADYPTIQTAIDVASWGDTVLVVPGTYYEHIVMKSGVIIKGSGADLTTIDGGGKGNVVTGVSDSMITGFTITGGNYGVYNNHYSSPMIDNNIITGNKRGIHCDWGWEGASKITNNTIVDNKHYGIFCFQAKAKIINNIISGSISRETYYDGIGLHIWGSPLTVLNNTITDNNFGIKFSGSGMIINNIISNNGHGIEGWGYSTAKIISNTITRNSAAISLEAMSSPTIFNNIITGNSVAIRVRDTSPTIINNVITSNRGGIAFYLFDKSVSPPIVTNNTITGNEYGIYWYGPSPNMPIITNNIITSNNTYGLWSTGESAPATISHNNIWNNGTNYYGSSAGPGDISADPKFVDPAVGDYHLQQASPCIDAGDNSAVPNWLTTDFEGESRIWDGNGDGLAVVDMGADEYYVRVVPATIDIKPDTLNLKSKGRWVTAYIELPNGYNVSDIDVSTVLLQEGNISAEITPTEISDYDNDGIADLMVKFNRAAVQSAVVPGNAVNLTVSGFLKDGIPFKGVDTVRIIDKR